MAEDISLTCMIIDATVPTGVDELQRERAKKWQFLILLAVILLPAIEGSYGINLFFHFPA